MHFGTSQQRRRRVPVHRSSELSLSGSVVPPPLLSWPPPGTAVCSWGAIGDRSWARLEGGVVGRGGLLHAQGRTRACWPEAVRGCGGGVPFVARGGSPGRGRCAPTGAGAAPATSCATCAAPTATNTPRRGAPASPPPRHLARHRPAPPAAKPWHVHRTMQAACAWPQQKIGTGAKRSLRGPTAILEHVLPGP